MTTARSFPGMNPYLENPYRWPEVHTWLIVEIARSLNPQLLPKYRAAVETRVYIDSKPIGVPDASVYSQSRRTLPQPTKQLSQSSVALVAEPERVTLPMPWEVTERYIEIREVSTNRVLTVIEVLSPANKRGGEGRRKYLEKRQKVLGSATHLIEIDLLRRGEPMPLQGAEKADYQILVSRANERPSAERYAFSLREEIPRFFLPLETDDVEPIIDLQERLHAVCRDTGIGMGIDYSAQPDPPLSDEDFAWSQTLLTA